MQIYKAKVTIHPLSYWLNSGGKGRGLLDNEVNFHKTGFPKLRASTFKGLLRESCTEVVEISGLKSNLIQKIFGKGAEKQGGALSFRRDFYITDWDKIRPSVEHVISSGELTADQIKNYYTQVVYQTKIEDGLAKDGSLRRLGVMKPMVTFETEVYLHWDDDKTLEGAEELLIRGCQNLLHLGTSRNRGFGRVNVQMEGFKKIDEGSLTTLSGMQLKVSIKNIGVLQLAQHGANPNEILTDRRISGSRIRGLLAHRYIMKKRKEWAGKNGEQNYDPNQDDDFYDLFLSGKVKYGNAYPQGGIPVPQNIHRNKRGEKITNIWKEQLESSKPIGGIVGEVSEVTKRVVVDTTLEFNMSRMDNRLAGISTKETNAIYYEEVIDEGNEFIGQIYATEQLIHKLTTVIGSEFSTHLGGNKSTMGYSEVSMKTSKPESNKGQVFQLIFLSPTILFNEFGYAQVTEEILSESVKEIHTKLVLDKERMALTSTMVEQYVTLWKSSTDRQIAIAPGSTIVVKSDEEIQVNERVFMGMKNSEGYGECLIIKYDENYFNKLENPDTHDFNLDVIDVVGEILIYSNNEAEQNKIKKSAIHKALKVSTNLSRSSISNILIAFKDANIPADVNEFLFRKNGDKIEKTYLGEKMDAENYLKGNSFNFSRWNTGKKFEEQSLFWVHFFQTMRLNKTQNEQ